MPLENVTANALLERSEYHKLSFDQLEKLDDAEALFQRADRLLWGMGINPNEKLADGFMIEAARRGHPLALGVCFLRGKGLDMNETRGVELLQASADRGYASGSRMNSHSIFQTHSSVLVGLLLSLRLWCS
jgi:hypothetical protein